MQTDRWNYPRLAEELRMIGAPVEDRRELFGRMIFNAVCGNDNDHVRNHAVVYRPEQRRWRRAPAFDVVPNPVETSRTLTLRMPTVSDSGAARDAGQFCDALLMRIENGFDRVAHWLDASWQTMLRARLQQNLSGLRASK